MIRLEVIHTADLGADKLARAHALLKAVFGADLTEDDWEHALGGLHALVWDGDSLIGHAALVQRRLMHGGRAMRTGYVEALAVHPDYRRRGHATTMMDALERTIDSAYALGALGASSQGEPLYKSRGWQQWRGELSALTPTGVKLTPEERGAIYVWPVDSALDPDAELTCDWREGDVW